MSAKLISVFILAAVINVAIGGYIGAHQNCPDLENSHTLFFFDDDRNGTEVKKPICAWLYQNQNCSTKTFIMTANETIASFRNRSAEEYERSRYWGYTSVRDTDSIFVNKGCNFTGWAAESFKGEIVRSKKSGLHNLGVNHKLQSATCTCDAIIVDPTAADKTETIIVEEKNANLYCPDSVILSSSTAKPFFIGMLLGSILIVCLYGLFTYREEILAMAAQIRVPKSKSSVGHSPSFNNPIFNIQGDSVHNVYRY